MDIVLGFLGTHGATIMLYATTVTGIASYVLKAAELIAPMTPTLKDDAFIKKYGKYGAKALAFLAANPRARDVVSTYSKKK
jgi:hypothetical protein